MRKFSQDAHDWVSTYYGSLNTTALLLAFEAGQRDIIGWLDTRNTAFTGTGPEYGADARAWVQARTDVAP